MSDSEIGQDGGESRRGAIKLGALGTSLVLTIRPGLAQAATSVLACEIPVPDAARAGRWIAADGTTVPAQTGGAFAPPAAPLKSADVKNALAGNTLRGTDPQASQAYINYVRKLQHGQSGFTCYASLQMPGR